MNVEDLFERYLTTKAQKMYERDESRRQTCQRKVDKVRGARGDLGAAFIIVEDDAGHCTNKDDLPFWWASCWDPSGVGSGGHLATTFLTGTLPATLRSQKKAGCKEPSARAILANSERKKRKTHNSQNEPGPIGDLVQSWSAAGTIRRKGLEHKKWEVGPPLLSIATWEGKS